MGINKILDGIKEHKDEFLKVHQSKLGGSNVATIANLNPYKNPFKLYTQMRGITEWEEENRAMRMGLKLEPVVAELFAEETGIGVEKADAVYENDKYPFAIASPDYFTSDGGILEIKTTSGYGAKNWEDGEIPDTALCQVQWYMGLLERPHAWVACLAGGRELIYKRVEFSKDSFEQLVEVGQKFMGMLADGVTPEANADDNPIISKLWKPDPTKEIQLDLVGEALAKRYMAQQEKVKTAEAEYTRQKKLSDTLKATIRMMMMDAHKATTPSGMRLYSSIVNVGPKQVPGYQYVRFMVRDVKED